MIAPCNERTRTFTILFQHNQINVIYSGELDIVKLFAEILHRPKLWCTKQVVRGVIGFSFQLAIIQHQLKNFTRLDIATCTRMEKREKEKKNL